MTTTPPGWYPDPEQAADDPARERWWDGTGWTGASRSRGAARGPLVAGAVGVVVLSASLFVGAALFAGLGMPDGPDPDDVAGNGGARPAPSEPEPGPSHSPPDDSAGPVTGVALPSLPGWQRQPGGTASGTEPYDCPGGGGECYRGAAVILPASGETASTAGGTTTPRDVAERDIGRNADTAYGGISGHRELTSGRTTVAGEPAYRIRWRTENRKGPDGYVESVVFPHPDGSGRTLVLRTALDIHRDAPPVRDMNRIAAGVRESGPAGGGDVVQT